MSQTEEIKLRIDVVDLIGESVPLRKTGRTFKAPCPFHTERTPSFVVDPERQSWRCFGACGEGGDIFSFVMKQQNIGFREALTILAERAGVPLAPLDQHAEERERRLTRLRSANESAATFFRTSLQQAPEAAEARAYVAERGLSDEVAETFGLGYAPDDRDGLQRYLLARGFQRDELIEAGLVLENDRDDLDRFRNRLMFPIRDQRGRCVGFGGRALNAEEGAKYLNTAQTPVFDKSGTLYAFDQARETARKEDRIIIVEGYMDVLAAHQFGQRNVVAAMGTSLTEKQVALIKPVTRNIVLALDADEAGAAATLRGIDTTREAVGTEQVPVLDPRGILRMQDTLAADIRILELPAGLDPDDLIRRDPGRWEALVDAAPGYLDYRFAQVKLVRDLNDPRERAAAVEDLLPIVGAIAQPVVRSEYVARLAAVARVETVAIEAMLRRRGQPQGQRLQQATAAQPTAPSRSDKQAEFLVKLVLIRPEVRADLPIDIPHYTEDTALRALLLACTDDAEDWTSALEPHWAAYLEDLRGEAAQLPPYSVAEAHQAAAQTVERLRQRLLRDELRALSQGIAADERATPGNAMTLAAAALEGAPTELETEIDETAIDDALRIAARQVLENQAKSRALHARRRVDTTEGEA